MRDIEKKSDTINLKKNSEIITLIPPLNTQSLISSGTKIKLFSTNYPVSPQTEHKKHFHSIVCHTQLSTKYNIQYYPPLDNNNITTIYKLHNIIHTPIINNTNKQERENIREKEVLVRKKKKRNISPTKKNLCNTLNTTKISKHNIMSMKHPYMLYGKKHTLPRIPNIYFLPRL